METVLCSSCQKASIEMHTTLLWLAYSSRSTQHLAWLKAFCLEGMGQEIKVAHPSVSIYSGTQSPQSSFLIPFWGILHRKGENLGSAFLLVSVKITTDVRGARSISELSRPPMTISMISPYIVGNQWVSTGTALFSMTLFVSKLSPSLW